MPNRPEAKPGVLKIAPYVPGRSVAEGHADPVKLSANESPLGASPAALAAYRDAASRLPEYPDGAATALRTAIGAAYGLEADRLVIGAGSDELLHLLAQIYLGPGDEAVISQYGFLVYPIVTQGAGATPVVAPETDHRTDVEAILGAVTAQTKIVFIANPNNPTGTYLNTKKMARLHAGLRSDILLVIDNAYAEYVTAGDWSDGSALARAHDNVTMVRTFSKVGLASLRVGWLYGPPAVVDALNRLRGPFNVSVPAQAAAEAAVGDVAFVEELRAHNAHWRAFLTGALDGNRFRVLPSQGNFVLVLFGDMPGLTAADGNRALLKAGLVVREMGGYGLPNGLRISIGTGPQMERVAEVLNGLEVLE